MARYKGAMSEQTPADAPGTAEVREVSLSLRAADGVSLVGRCFEPSGAVQAAVLIAPAMGVPQRFYAPFARFLADQGMAALTLDYRGIGESRHGSLRSLGASLADWGDLDLRAALDALRARYGDVPTRWVGHSVGGQLLGLIGDEGIDRALLVASQSGYWRHWPLRDRAKIWLLWHAVIPTVAPLTGRLPAKVLGGGDDIPPGVARQWATWGRHPRYIASLATQRARHGFQDFQGSLRAYVFSDDAMAPRKAAEGLLCEFAVKGELVEVQPADFGVKGIGHFGAFRRGAPRPLWKDFAAFLALGE